MDSTSTSLLARVTTLDPEAWRVFVELYGPLVYEWCRRCGLQPDDAADVAQETFLAVASKVSNFRRERKGDSFRQGEGTRSRYLVGVYDRAVKRVVDQGWWAEDPILLEQAINTSRREVAEALLRESRSP